MNTDNYGFDVKVYDWDELKTVNNTVTCLDCGYEIGSCECGSEESEMIAEVAIFETVECYNAKYGNLA